MSRPMAAVFGADNRRAFRSDYYLHQGGYVFVVVCLFICLFVSNFAQKRPNGFAWNFQGRLAMASEQKWLNFDGDPDQGFVSQHW